MLKLKSLVKPVAAAAAIAVTAVSLAAPAEAGRRHHHGGNAAAAAILGLGIGAVIGGAMSGPSYHYYEPRPYPRRRVYYDYYPPEPWTPEWYAYCYSKYDSFDEVSGTFQPYYGPRRLCR